MDRDANLERPAGRHRCEIIDSPWWGSWSHRRLTLSPRADFWRRYHEFRRIRQKETRPDEPVRNDADEEAHLKRISPFQAEKYFEVSRGREMLGLLQMSFVEPAAPRTNPTGTSAKPTSSSAARTAGVESRLRFLPAIVELMDRRGCTKVGGWVEEDAGHGFMKWVGAESKLAEIGERLMFSEIDWRSWNVGLKKAPGDRPTQGSRPSLGGAGRRVGGIRLTTVVMLNTIPFEASTTARSS